MLEDLKTANEEGDEQGFPERLQQFRSRLTVDVKKVRVKMRNSVRCIRTGSSLAAQKLRRGVTVSMGSVNVSGFFKMYIWLL